MAAQQVHASSVQDVHIGWVPCCLTDSSCVVGFRMICQGIVLRPHAEAGFARCQRLGLGA